MDIHIDEETAKKAQELISTIRMLQTKFDACIGSDYLSMRESENLLLDLKRVRVKLALLIENLDAFKG